MLVQEYTWIIEIEKYMNTMESNFNKINILKEGEREDALFGRCCFSIWKKNFSEFDPIFWKYQIETRILVVQGRIKIDWESQGNFWSEKNVLQFGVLFT